MNNDTSKIPEHTPLEERAAWFVENKNKFCLLPWINIHTNPDGKIKLCCNVHIDHFVQDADKNYNLGYHSIEEIWLSKYMQDARVMTLDGAGLTECQGCYNVEKVSGHSPRLGQNKLWMARKQEDNQLSDFLDNSPASIHLTQVKNPNMLPVSLELRLGNQCNLKCVTCWGMSSSLIYNERREALDSGLLDGSKLTWFKKKWTEDCDAVEADDIREWYETDMFFNNMEKLAPTLKRFYTTGGEPTLIKSNYRIFQLLIDNNNTDCKIEFTSNMTTWNEDFYSRLENFNNVEIQMSIDGVDDIAEYIRYPSNFSRVKENIFRAAKLAATRPGWTIKCFTVLQALNFKHIGGIWKLLNEAATMYDVNIDWWPITLNYPEHLSLKSIAKDLREEAIYKLAKSRKQYIDTIGKFYISHHTWSTLADSITNAEFDEKYQQKLITFVNLNDQLRNLDGELLFAELLIPVKLPKQNVFTR